MCVCVCVCRATQIASVAIRLASVCKALVLWTTYGGGGEGYWGRISQGVVEMKVIVSEGGWTGLALRRYMFMFISGC